MLIQKLTRKRIIEPLQERDNCALSAPTGSDQCQSLPRFHMDVQTLKNFDVGTGRVVEVEFTSLNLTHNLALQRTVHNTDCEN